MCAFYTRFGCTFRTPFIIGHVDHFRHMGSFISFEMDTGDFRIEYQEMDTEAFGFIPEMETGISPLLSLLLDMDTVFRLGRRFIPAKSETPGMRKVYRPG